MSKDDMLLVRRETLSFLLDGGRCDAAELDQLREAVKQPAEQHQGEPVLTKPTIKQLDLVFSDEDGTIRIKGFSFENGSMELAMDDVADAVRAAGMKAFTDGCTWRDFYDTERKP
ncbi:MAG: hypothetical protein [Caudoviricetes sp.]|nr:MAG: hypothetical protein [Caudoviricetes sp.]